MCVSKGSILKRCNNNRCVSNTHGVNRLEFFAQRVPLERQGWVEGIEAGQESLLADRDNRLSWGHSSLVPLEVMAGQDQLQKALGFVNNSR